MFSYILLWFTCLTLSKETSVILCGNNVTVPHMSARCYWLINKPLNFTDAHKHCQDEGGILAEIPDNGVQLVLNEKFPFYRYPDIWIGVNDIEEEHNFVNMLNEAVRFTKWNSSEPNNRDPNVTDDDGDCVKISSGFWHDASCSNTFPALCSKGQTIAVSQTSGQTTTQSTTTYQPTVSHTSGQTTTQSTTTHQPTVSHTTDKTTTQSTTTYHPTVSHTTDKTTTQSTTTYQSTVSQTSGQTTTQSTTTYQSTVSQTTDKTSKQSTNYQSTISQTSGQTPTQSTTTYQLTVSHTSGQTTTQSTTTYQPTVSQTNVQTTGLGSTRLTTKEQFRESETSVQTSTQSAETDPQSVPQTSRQAISSEQTTDTTSPVIQERVCKCPCSRMKNRVIIKNEAELLTKIDNMKNELAVNKSLLSSSIRKRISAVDPRPSASIVGGTISVVIIATVVGLIVLSDITRVINFCWKTISKRWNRKTRAVQKGKV